MAGAFASHGGDTAGLMALRPGVGCDGAGFCASDGVSTCTIEVKTFVWFVWGASAVVWFEPAVPWAIATFIRPSVLCCRGRSTRAVISNFVSLLT